MTVIQMQDYRTLATLHTDGRGYWTRKINDVRIIGLKVPYINEDEDFGELRVYFNTTDWDVRQDGLIYTDDKFLVELQLYLESAGLTVFADYSEQGMQGPNYVSCDVGPSFLTAYKEKFPVAYKETYTYLHQES
jgi:hypothetical protein